jgi:transforming growth factor-beta-induced protein
MKRSLKVLAGGLAAGAIALAPMTAGAVDDDSIAAIAIEAGDFDTLVAAVTAAGLVDVVGDCSQGPFTVFAPTDDAFAALGEVVDLEAVIADTGTLTTILTYHVVAGAVLAADVVELTEATTLAGQDVTITVDGDSVVLNDDINVIATDIEACNGVIHVIDGVLVPPSIADAVPLLEADDDAADEAAADLPSVGVNSALLAALAGAALLGGVGIVGATRRRSDA